MRRGFFPEGVWKKVRTALPVANCAECGLYKKCQSPKMPVAGRGEKKIMIIGEAPGEREDLFGKPFVGKSGQRLAEELASWGADLDRDCWRTNALICRPPGNKLAALPRNTIVWCRPNVQQAVLNLQPEVIILLGGAAVQSVCGWLWREEVGSVTRWAGLQIPCQKLNAWVCPTWHPAHVLRGEDEGRGEVLATQFRDHLQFAFTLNDREEDGGRPWPELPDYPSRVKVVHDPAEAAAAIHLLAGIAKGPIAFDYETNRLKPDHQDAAILTCAISNGDHTFAFPWVGKARKEMKKVLRSGKPMVASNMKFEERWTVREFGMGVKKWDFDTMLAAHVLDCRAHINSIKFQAFARLGEPCWDLEIGPYMNASDSNTANRLRGLRLGSLLQYNGMDALMEYEVMRLQKQDMGR